jgi:hypothetical protein
MHAVIRSGTLVEDLHGVNQKARATCSTYIQTVPTTKYRKASEYVVNTEE